MSEISKSFKWNRVEWIPIVDEVSGPLQVQLANESHVARIGCWYGWVR